MEALVKTRAGIFILETSPRGLYRVRFSSRMPPQRMEKFFKPPDEIIPNVKLDLNGCTHFQRKVYAALVKVPFGKTVTYGALARRAGYPGAARAVGTAMKNNRLPVVIPCHRVVPFRGGIGEYAHGKRWKRWLLEYEVSGCPRVKVPRPRRGKVTR